MRVARRTALVSFRNPQGQSGGFFGRMTRFFQWSMVVAVVGWVSGGAAPTQAAVAITPVTTPAGLEVWLAEDDRSPVIAVSFAFAGGAGLDPPDKVGVSRLAMELLEEGAGERDAQAFKAALKDQGIRLGFAADADFLGGALVTLPESLDAAVALTADALLRPRLQESDLERRRAAALAAERQQAGDPGAVANRTFRALVYPDHPYGRDENGDAAGLAAVSRADVQARLVQGLRRDRLLISAAGAITPERLAQVVDRMFASLPLSDTATASAALPPAEPGNAGERRVENRPTAQSLVVMGHAGPTRDHPDWFALTLLNQILGGSSFTSRLGTEIRDRRGLSYGVYSRLEARQAGGLWVVSGATANANASTMEGLIRTIWNEVAENGVTEDELADAKTFLTGSFPLRFTATPAISDLLLQMRKDRLGRDYLEQREAAIMAVTREAVRRVARTWLKADSFRTVIVGQPQ